VKDAPLLFPSSSMEITRDVPNTACIAVCASGPVVLTMLSGLSKIDGWSLIPQSSPLSSGFIQRRIFSWPSVCVEHGLSIL
jgi:hypothetical protein